MANPKVSAYCYSNELAGTEMKQQEVELIDSRTENGVTTYFVKTNEGIVCKAIFNVFTCCYYADDVYGVVNRDKLPTKSDMEM